jgi:hypothetical protein
MQIAADERQSPQLSPLGAANEGQQPLPASSIRAPERQQSQTALQSDSPETQRSRRRTHRQNGDAAAPSNKRQKISHQVDGASFNMRRSNRDRRPTLKATEDR